jgi:hypothetical protein
MLATGGNADPIARGFEILAAVGQPDFTRWSIVYDLSTRDVYFRTDGNRAVRRFALAGFDFASGTPVKMLDVTAAGAGDGRQRKQIEVPVPENPGVGGSIPSLPTSCSLQTWYSRA